MNTGEFLAMLDDRHGCHYPTLDDYQHALETVRAAEFLRTELSRPTQSQQSQHALLFARQSQQSQQFQFAAQNSQSNSFQALLGSLGNGASRG